MADPHRAEKVTKALREIEAASSDVVAAAMVSTDGFIIASLLPGGVGEDQVASAAATLHAAAEGVAAKLLGGGMDQVIVRGKDSALLVISTGSAGWIVLLTAPDVKVDPIRREIARHAADLG